MSTGLRVGYQQTEVGVIPEDWVLKALGEIAVTASGTTPARDQADRYYRNGTVHWVKTLDLNNTQITATDEQVTHLAVSETSLRPYPVGTVLVAMYGGFNQIGRTGLLRISAAVNQAITAVQPHPTKLHSEYLLAVLNFRVDYWKGVASSSRKDPNITSQDVRAFPIALPLYSEQRAIAAALGDVDALLDGLDSLIAKKRDLKQAAMQQLLTGQTCLPGFSGEWEVKRLGDVAEIVMGQSPSSMNYNSKGDGLPLIQGNADITNRQTIKRVFTTQITKQGVAGDILMSVRAPVGEVSRTAFDVCLGRGVCAIRFPNEFLYHYLIFIEPNWAKHSKGSTFDSVNSADVNAVEIHLPVDTAEQAAIAAVLSDMDAELATLEARRDKTRNLKQAMMQELLTGKTRLVEPASNVIPVDFSAKAQPTASQQPATGTAHNWAINEAVVVAVLVKQFGSEQYPLGRKRCTKLSYLMHRHVEHVAQGYLKKAAGPYNPSVKYKGPESIAQKNGYIRTHASGKFSGFVAAEKVAQAEGYFEKWYGQDVLAWLEQFRRKTNDELELLATVDMAVEDLRRAGKPVDVGAVKSVIHDNPEWEAKLEREIFSDANIARAIAQTKALFQ